MPLKTTDPTELTDAALADGMAAARGRYSKLSRLSKPLAFAAGPACLLASFALIPLPFSIIIGLFAAALATVATGTVIGQRQYRLKTEERSLHSESHERQQDPQRHNRTMQERFEKAMQGGTGQHITVKKPLKIKTQAAAP